MPSGLKRLRATEKGEVSGVRWAGLKCEEMPSDLSLAQRASLQGKVIEKAMEHLADFDKLAE